MKCIRLGALRVSFLQGSRLNNNNIYFINHCLSASLLRPDGVKHNIHDTHAHINNTQHIDHKTQPPDDAPHASPRVASHAGPCATPFHTWGVARGPAGGCFTPWSPYHPKPLPYRAPAVPTLLIPPAPAAYIPNLSIKLKNSMRPMRMR